MYCSKGKNSKFVNMIQYFSLSSAASDKHPLPGNIAETLDKMLWSRADRGRLTDCSKKEAVILHSYNQSQSNQQTCCILSQLLFNTDSRCQFHILESCSKTQQKEKKKLRDYIFVFFCLYISCLISFNIFILFI